LPTVPEHDLTSTNNGAFPRISHHQQQQQQQPSPTLSGVIPEELATQLVSKLQPETVKSLISSDQSQHSIDLIAQMLNALSGGTNTGQSGDHSGHSPTAVDSMGNAFGSPTDLKRCITDPWLSSHSPSVAPAPGTYVCDAESPPSVAGDQSKAPGNNRPKKSINSSFYQEESDFTDVDYEQMRVKAYRGTVHLLISILCKISAADRSFSVALIFSSRISAYSVLLGRVGCMVDTFGWCVFCAVVITAYGSMQDAMPAMEWFLLNEERKWKPIATNHRQKRKM
jgi:hypothetical protein